MKSALETNRMKTAYPSSRGIRSSTITPPKEGAWKLVLAREERERESKALLKEALKALRLGLEAPVRGPITAADFRFGSTLAHVDPLTVERPSRPAARRVALLPVRAGTTQAWRA